MKSLLLFLAIAVAASPALAAVGGGSPQRDSYLRATVESTFSRVGRIKDTMRVFALDTTYKSYNHFYFDKYSDSSCTNRNADTVAMPVNQCIAVNGGGGSSSAQAIKWITDSSTTSVTLYPYSNSGCSTISLGSTQGYNQGECNSFKPYGSTNTEYLKTNTLQAITGEVPRAYILPDLWGLGTGQAVMTTYVTGTTCTPNTSGNILQRIMAFTTDTCYRSESNLLSFIVTNEKDVGRITYYSDTSCTNQVDVVDYTHETCYVPPANLGASTITSFEFHTFVNLWAIVFFFALGGTIFCCFMAIIPIIGCCFFAVAVYGLVLTITAWIEWQDKGSASISF